MDIHICMYNRENIDPRYLGLHEHLGVLDCSKSISNDVNDVVNSTIDTEGDTNIL